jgi:hypothetical protein
MLLGAKLATLAFLLSRTDGLRDLPDHFIPFITFFTHLGPPKAFHHALIVLAALAAIALLLNIAVRTACLAMGVLVLVGIVSTRNYFHVNHLYFALLMVFVALYDRRVGTRLIRYQLAVIYAGAALNKLLDADWRDGAFVRDWLPHYVGGWRHLFSGGAVIPGALGWIAILTELALVVLLLVPRWVPVGAWLGFAYHTGLTTITAGQTFGLFWYTMLASYLMLMAWPEADIHIELGARLRGLAAALGKLDADARFRCTVQPAAPLTVGLDTRSYTGAAAWARILVYLPLASMTLVVLVALIQPAWILVPVSLLVLAGLALPPRADTPGAEAAFAAQLAASRTAA